jgi:hypothetical protein
MCSNCSGDDLRPESFTSFDVSSPNNGARFAESMSRKRKRYGTTKAWSAFTKWALTLTIVRKNLRGCLSRIIADVYQGSFVNLNLGASSGEGAEKVQAFGESAGLIEIRVSANSIIEVYSTSNTADNPLSDAGFTGRGNHSTWEENYAERFDLQRTMDGLRRTWRWKYFVAYCTFVTFAALAVWFAVR